MKEAMLKAVDEANKCIFEKSLTSSEYAGMGTTLVGAVYSKGLVTVVNVGDSRAYVIDENGITKITCDHSLVEEMVKRGEITEVEAQRHPNKNLITRALGAEPRINADVFDLEVKEGQYILLCSDGLTNLVSDQELLFEVLHAGKQEECCNRLVKTANKRGGFDNITVILLAV